MSERIRSYLFMLSAVFVLTGALSYITHWIYSPYIFAVGAAGVTVCFLTTPSKHLSLRLRRLHRINIMAGVMMIVASSFMFKRKMEWVVFLFIGALMILYTSLVGSRHTDK